MRIAAVVAATLALAGCVGAPPTSVSVAAFDVSGGNLKQLVAATRVHGPKVGNADGAFAAVVPRLAVSFTARQRGATCRYDPRGRVEVKTLLVLPRWRAAEKGSKALAAKWSLVTRYALLHEVVHIRIFQAYARRLETMYRSASAPDCATLAATLAREKARLTATMAAQQDAFDKYDYPRFAALIAIVDAN